MKQTTEKQTVANTGETKIRQIGIWQEDKENRRQKLPISG